MQEFRATIPKQTDVEALNESLRTMHTKLQEMKQQRAEYLERETNKERQKGDEKGEDGQDRIQGTKHQEQKER